MLSLRQRSHSGQHFAWNNFYITWETDIKITVIMNYMYTYMNYIHRLQRHDRALQRDAPRRLTTLWHWPLRHDRALQRHLGGSPHCDTGHWDMIEHCRHLLWGSPHCDTGHWDTIEHYRHLLGGSPHWAQVQNERCTFKQLQTSSASCAHVTDFVLSTKLRCTRRCVTTACRWHPTCTVTRSVLLLKFRAYRREIQAFSSN